MKKQFGSVPKKTIVNYNMMIILIMFLIESGICVGKCCMKIKCYYSKSVIDPTQYT